MPTQQQAEAIHAAGWDGVIPGLQFPRPNQNFDPARLQIEAFERAGMYVGEAYQWFGWTDGGDASRMKRAIEIAHEYGLWRLWIDIEWDTDSQGPNMPGPGIVLPNLADYRRQIEDAGFAVGIYTGEPYWKGMCGNSTLHRDLPLWHAWYYNDRRVPNFNNFRPYGGFTRPLIWQYHDSTNVAGFSFDFNITEVDLMPAQPEPTPIESPSPVNDFDKLQVIANIASDKYTARFHSRHAGGWAVYEVCNPDGSPCDPQILIADRR